MKLVRCKIIIFILFVTICVVGKESIKPLLPKNIDWVGRVNVSRFVETNLGKKIIKKYNLEELTKTELFTKNNFSPLVNIEAITLGGKGDKIEEFVAILTGNFNQNNIEKYVKLSSSIKQIQHKNHLIWKNKMEGTIDNEITADESHKKNKANKKIQNKKDSYLYFCIYSNELIIFSLTEEQMIKIIDLQKEKDRKKQNTIPIPQNSILYLNITNFATIDKFKPKAKLLEISNGLIINITNTNNNNKSTVNLTLNTSSEESAKQILDIIKGMIALGTLGSNNNIKNLGNSIVYKIAGKNVELKIDIADKLVLDALHNVTINANLNQ